MGISTSLVEKKVFLRSASFIRFFVFSYLTKRYSLAPLPRLGGPHLYRKIWIGLRLWFSSSYRRVVAPNFLVALFSFSVTIAMRPLPVLFFSVSSIMWVYSDIPVMIFPSLLRSGWKFWYDLSSRNLIARFHSSFISKGTSATCFLLFSLTAFSSRSFLAVILVLLGPRESKMLNSGCFFHSFRLFFKVLLKKV